MLRKLGWILFVAALSSGVTFAQSTLGTILGTVTDQSGAVIANAEVRITSTDEGTLRTLTTDTSGNFEAVNSKPGQSVVGVDSALRQERADFRLPQRSR